MGLATAPLGKDGRVRGRAKSVAVRAILTILAGLATALPVTAKGDDPIAEGVFQGLQEGRIASGAKPFRRDPALDKAAAARAREVATRPEGRRFAYDRPIAELVREAGLRRFVRAGQYVATQGGYEDQAEAALRNWREYEDGWRNALDRSWTAASVATTRSTDGLLIVVAVFLEDESPLPEPDVLERETWEATNREREERGLSALAWNDGLAAVARAHSRDMARRGYFGHDSPEGRGPSDRAREARIEYRRLAENVASNLHMEAPVATAVKGWIESPSHRKNLLNPVFTHTGIGVAVDDDGLVIFTQMFLLPAPREDGARP